MNTRCHVVLPGLDTDKAEQVFSLLKKEVARVEQDLSRFIPDSVISQINNNAAQKPVLVNDEVFEILQTCRKYYDLTEGAFDITLRPLLDFWRNNIPESADENQLNEIINSTGMDKVILDETENSVTFGHEGIEIDLGGYGKGYALELLNKSLRKFSVESAFISFGESSILTRGHHPAGDHWQVGMNDYLNPGSSLHTFKVRDGSVSTSSNFYVDDRGKLQNHRHVISPFSGHPVGDFKSVSVCSGSPVLAEIFSTAFLVSSDEFIHTILQSEETGLVDAIKADYTSGESVVTRFHNLPVES